MYTTVIHPIRTALCLSVNEYCVLDCVYQLSNNVKYHGWCVASKDYLSKTLDLGERTIFKILNTLEEKELIERNERGELRTLDVWNELIANKNDYIIGFKGKETQFLSGKALNKAKNLLPPAEIADPMQKVHTTYAKSAESGMQKVQSNYAKSAYNNNNIIKEDNNIDNKREETPAQQMEKFLKLMKNKDQSYKDLISYLESEKKIPPDISSAELDKFVNYWTELNKSGTKQRWELEKTFEVQRRLATWFGRVKGVKQNEKPITQF